MTRATEHSEGTPDTEQNRGARAGAQAAGGIAAQPGDPTSPAEAAARAKARDDAQEDGGDFGEADASEAHERG